MATNHLHNAKSTSAYSRTTTQKWLSSMKATHVEIKLVYTYVIEVTGYCIDTELTPLV